MQEKWRFNDPEVRSAGVLRPLPTYHKTIYAPDTRDLPVFWGNFSPNELSRKGFHWSTWPQKDANPAKWSTPGVIEWDCPVDLVECWNWGRWDPAHLVFRQTKSWRNKTIYPETSLHGETSLHTDFLFCRFSRWTWVMTCIHRVWTELGWIQKNNSDVECGMVMSLHVPGPKMVTSIQGGSLRNQQTVVFVNFSRLRWTGWFLSTKLQVPQLEIEELHVWRVEPMFRCGEPASLRSPVLFRHLWCCQIFFDPDPGSNWNLASL